MVNLRNESRRKSLQVNSKSKPKKKGPLIPNKVKNNVINPIVERLVKEKIHTKKKLQKGTIEKEVEMLIKAGINWITVDKLRHQVHRMHKNYESDAMSVIDNVPE